MNEELKVRWQASLLILLCWLVFPIQVEAQINETLVTRLCDRGDKGGRNPWKPKGESPGASGTGPRGTCM